ncbi:MAG: DNA internalization-related competence protein ComEC/Rec2 [Methylotenera sp.]|uniref:DNA internalization-related competence protein ComEC/Rec2 n=1 Tax=Methylotenera sp. TaxID=2051956 RepID=UPI0024879973|nr:DNA internalization-related competence protein ComEC/Rec2 [Methylotenera sp.]MDI1310264.1 DNA internalization-related competence protein ComEC/Rec2 [Methylotenera sp.]
MALMFVFGAWNVQHLAQLPTLTWLLFALFVMVATIAIQFHPRFSSNSQPLRFFKSTLRCAAAFLFGLCWASSYAYWRIADELPHAWEQKSIAIEGIVASVPEATEVGVRFKFYVEKILTKGAVVPKHISLNQYRRNSYGGSKSTEKEAIESNEFKVGERWSLVVRLKRPHGAVNPHGFDFESWALSENIRATGSIKSKAGIKKLDDFVWQPRYMVEFLREKVQKRIEKVLAGKPYSGIIQALVMGDDSQIDVEDWQVFLRTGTSHLMSISGLHITMLAGLAFAFVSFFWRRSHHLVMHLPTRKAATVAGVVIALAYSLIAGFSVPSQRTLYMLFVFAVALWSGRQLVISQVLAMALLIVVMLDPWAVSSPGFWLSFGAVAMLAYALGGRIGEVHWFQAALKTQYAVTIGMLPLLLIMFGQTSIVSPIANAFAIPLISFVVTPLALLGSFLPANFLTDIPLHVSYKALEVGMCALKWLNELPMATWQQHEPAAWTLIPAIFGVLWLLLPRGFPMRWMGLVGFLPILMNVPIRPALGEMKVTVLDVGQGLSVVVQTAKHNLVYDAGPKFNEQSDAGSRIVMPFLRGEGIKKIDGFVVSHNDIDHSGGMPSILALMPVRWLNSSLPDDADIPASQRKMRCYAGQQWLWDDVKFEIIHPRADSYDDKRIKDNDRSCVLKVTSQAGSVLLTGDIEKADELQLINSEADKLRSDVIVVPHHGSKTSSTSDFIAAVAPSVSIITNGYLNRFGHPKPVILERYLATNSLLYRSDYNGAVEMRFMHDGNIQILSWRSQYKRYWLDNFENLN